MVLIVLYLSNEDDNFIENTCSFPSNRNKHNIISIFLNNESLLNHFINFLRLENKSIFIYTSFLLIDLFDTDSKEFKFMIKSKGILDIYLNIFDFGYKEMDEFSVNLIFEILLNYFKLILLPLINDSEFEMILRTDLKKFLISCKNHIFCNYDIKIIIITYIGIMARCFSNHIGIYIQEIIQSETIQEIINSIHNDLKNQIMSGDSYGLDLQMIFKIFEYLTSQSDLFIKYLLLDLKLIDVLNIFINNFEIPTIVKKSAFKLLSQLASGSREDSIITVECIFIKKMEDELNIAYNQRETGFIKHILNILNILLSYNDPYITRKINSKGLLISLFRLLDDNNEIINNLPALELLNVILEKLIVSFNNFKSENVGFSSESTN